MLRFVSADDHLIEGPSWFEGRWPARLRGREPRILPGVDGGEGWSFDGGPPKAVFGLNAIAGQAFEDFRNVLTFSEILPGNYDGAARLKDMDVDGMAASVLFPGAALDAYVLEDREFAVAVMEAYNGWLLDEFCAVDRSRLWGLGMVPANDGIEAILRVSGAAIAKGACGLFLPYHVDRPYWDAFYDPLWALAVEADVPVSIHRMQGGLDPEALTVELATPGINVAQMVCRYFSGIPPITTMVFTGVFERFPALQLVNAEVNMGWVPFWTQMIEEVYERQRHWAQVPIERNPRELVGQNIFFTVLDDYNGFAQANVDDSLMRAGMFSADYPHSSTLWPNCQRYLAKLTDGMETARVERLLNQNATEVFGKHLA